MLYLFLRICKTCNIGEWAFEQIIMAMDKMIIEQKNWKSDSKQWNPFFVL